jgi:hypothetical protein
MIFFGYIMCITNNFKYIGAWSVPAPLNFKGRYRYLCIKGDMNMIFPRAFAPRNYKSTEGKNMNISRGAYNILFFSLCT